MRFLKQFQDTDAAGLAIERRSRLDAYHPKEKRLKRKIRKSACFCALRDAFQLFGSLESDVFLSGGSVISLLETGQLPQDADLDFSLPCQSVIAEQNARTLLVHYGFSHVPNHPLGNLYRYENSARKIEAWVTPFTLHQDAIRRDFTVCALYLDSLGRIYDPTQKGIRDLMQNCLECVLTDAYALLCADPLKRFRAIRYWAEKYFTVGGKLENALDMPWNELSVVMQKLVLYKLVTLLGVQGKYQKENLSIYNRLVIGMEAVGFLEKLIPGWNRLSDETLQNPFGPRSKFLRQFYEMEYGQPAEEAIEEIEEASDEEKIETKEEVTPLLPASISSVSAFRFITKLASRIPDPPGNRDDFRKLKKFQEDYAVNRLIIKTTDQKLNNQLANAILKEMYCFSRVPLEETIRRAFAAKMPSVSQQERDQAINEFFACVEACGIREGCRLDHLHSFRKAIAEIASSKLDVWVGKWLVQREKMEAEVLKRYGLEMRDFIKGKPWQGAWLRMRDEIELNQTTIELLNDLIPLIVKCEQKRKRTVDVLREQMHQLTSLPVDVSHAEMCIWKVKAIYEGHRLTFRLQVLGRDKDKIIEDYRQLLQESEKAAILRLFARFAGSLFDRGKNNKNEEIHIDRLRMQIREHCCSVHDFLSGNYLFDTSYEKFIGFICKDDRSLKTWQKLFASTILLFRETYAAFEEMPPQSVPVTGDELCKLVRISHEAVLQDFKQKKEEFGREVVTIWRRLEHGERVGRFRIEEELRACFYKPKEKVSAPSWGSLFRPYFTAKRDEPSVSQSRGWACQIL